MEHELYLKKGVIKNIFKIKNQYLMSGHVIPLPLCHTCNRCQSLHQHWAPACLTVPSLLIHLVTLAFIFFFQHKGCCHSLGLMYSVLCPLNFCHLNVTLERSSLATLSEVPLYCTDNCIILFPFFSENPMLSEILIYVSCTK